MGTLSYCNDYEEAAALLGVIAEYVEMPKMSPDDIADFQDNIYEWIGENLQGMVFWIREQEFDKIFITFLFQYSEDAVAFKLYWS